MPTAQTVPISADNFDDFAPFFAAGAVEDCLDKPSAAFGLFLENKPCGAAVALCQEDMVLRLLSIYVLPDERRQGLGRTLLDAMCGWGKKNGCSHLSAHYLLEEPVLSQVDGLLTHCGWTLRSNGMAFAAVEVKKYLSQRQTWPPFPKDVVLSPWGELPSEIQIQLLPNARYAKQILPDLSLAMLTPQGETAYLLLGYGDTEHSYLLLEQSCDIAWPGAALALLLAVLTRLVQEDPAATLQLLTHDQVERERCSKLFPDAIAYWTEQRSAKIPLAD